ncbi:protein CHROMATIN REMODELING 24 [Rosa sericea]
MAEKKSSRKPQSLNDSHYRLLQDLSSAPPKPSEQGKATKVRIEGARRLCKIRVASDDDDDHGEGFNGDDAPSFSGIADFESPPQPQRSEVGNGGGNEIRGILDDLSSRLEFLSIERKGARKSNKVEVSGISKEVDGVKKEKVEYKDAAPSFSIASDLSDSSAETTKTGRKGVESVVDEYEEKTHFQCKFEEADDDRDCVVVRAKKTDKQVGRRGGGSYKEYYDCDENSEVDVSRDNSVPEDDGSITLSGLTYTYKLPGKIAKMLFPHQREGMKWLWALHCQGKGGILGDDMGLGKTMQICGYLAGLFHSRLIKRAMVVAPKTLLSHWIKELSAVGLSDKIREYYGTCTKARKYELQYVLQDKGILLTTYDIVRVNSKSLKGSDYILDDGSEDMIWDYMILDEGHLIKNPSTQRAKSLLDIPCSHRIIVSGTPLQNNLKELWALFNFCCPELLGDKNWFKERFESRICRGNEKNASDREKRIGSTVAQELRDRIQPFFLRRLKNEVFKEDNDQTNATLSKKNEIIVWLRLTSCQRKLYEAYLKSELVLSAFDGSPLAALTILKKICDHPLLLTKRAAEDVLEELDSLLKPDDACMAEKLAMHIADVAEKEEFDENHANLSCKISFIMSLLDNLIPEGHNVLIFSQTRKMLNLIQETLISSGYKFQRIDGTTKATERIRIVNDFQEGIGAPIFLLTSQVGGLGLTLTRADRVIVVDPAWNPSTDSQSVDRAYRIGQNKDVIVYRLMTCATVEEKIYRKQIYKGGLFRTATEQKEQIRYFSQQDLRELFSLPQQGFDVSLTQKQLNEEHDQQHTMEETLQAHIEFLETQGIAGVSNHSLLFSKTAPPLPEVDAEQEEVERIRRTLLARSSTSSSAPECNVNGAEYAFKPKDVILNKKMPSSPAADAGKMTKSEIKENINRLSQTLANKALVSRLPDKGQKIQRQISELNAELRRLEKDVIDLDDVTEELKGVVV